MEAVRPFCWSSDSVGTGATESSPRSCDASVDLAVAALAGETEEGRAVSALGR